MVTELALTPHDLGLPPKFSRWRPYQGAAIIRGMDSEKRFVAQAMPTGCHARGQLILMHDGSLRPVELIQAGDSLMGPDSGPREVLELHHGEGPLYRVIPVKGDPFTVNSGHVLTLNHNPGLPLHGRPAWEDIPLETWLESSRNFKWVRKLVRVGVEFNKQNLPLDPYFLGILIGDGSLTCGVQINKPDEEIHSEMRKQAEKFALRYGRTGATSRVLTVPNRWHPNAIYQILRDLGLAVRSPDRFVPAIYKTSSREDRLELLAGLLDTDGHCTGNCYDYISASWRLSDDVAYICRSLGLAAYVTAAEKSCPGKTGIYHRVSISGPTHQIPCRITRKRARVRRQKKSALRTAFRAEPVGLGEYWGFTVQGDGRYLLGDFTVTHNSGKSVVYVARALLTDQRVAVITSTKALQEQLLNDFGELGMTDIRGRANYPCSMSGGMTCEDGAHAGCRMNGTGGCPYSCAYQIAKQARFVVTNYPYWMLQNKYGEGLGKFDLLVLDESHAAPDEVCDVMAVSLNGREVYRMLGADFPGDGASMDTWRAWALVLLPRARASAGRTAEAIKLRVGMGDEVGLDRAREAREWKNLVSKLETLATMRGQWEAEATKSGYRVDPLWASQHSDILFLDVPHVLATSATVVPKTLEMLGIPNDELDFQEYPSIFPAYRSPVIFVPTVRVTHEWTAGMMDLWLRRIDQLLSRRLDRKGIIHTVSYARRDLILASSMYADDMISHSTKDAVRRVEVFRNTPPPAILVSPSMATGWDFPYCVAPETRVLMADLKWLQAGALDVGDSLLAFAEEISPPLLSRTWQESIVTGCEPIMAPCYRLIFEDGTTVICSAEHKWLMASWKGHHRTAGWQSTSELRDGSFPILRERGRFAKHSQAGPSHVARLLDVWDTARDWEAGYLAAAFNGEGSLCQSLNAKARQIQLNFVQQENIMLADVQAILLRKGYPFRLYRRPRAARMRADCFTVKLIHREDILRFLGQIRPSRLLPKLNCAILGSVRSKPLKLMEKEDVGMQEVVALATTTRTLIAEGLASHNSDCEYQIIAKVPYPDTRSRIMSARVKADPRYQDYVTTQQLVQSCGRGMRASDDSCESICIDDMIRAVMASCRDLLPKWFRRLYRRRDCLPEPPKKLERRR